MPAKFDRLFIEKKLCLLADYVGELEPLVHDMPLDQIQRDKHRLKLIERYFQLAVDTMNSINVHLIKEGDFGEPDDFQGTFKTIGSAGILDETFAERIAPIVGVRNMIVHQYEKIDLSLFLKNLKDNFSDFKKYLTQINTYLQRQAGDLTD